MDSLLESVSKHTGLVLVQRQVQVLQLKHLLLLGEPEHGQGPPEHRRGERVGPLHGVALTAAADVFLLLLRRHLARRHARPADMSPSVSVSSP